MEWIWFNPKGLHQQTWLVFFLAFCLIDLIVGVTFLPKTFWYWLSRTIHNIYPKFTLTSLLTEHEPLSPTTTCAKTRVRFLTWESLVRVLDQNVIKPQECLIKTAVTVTLHLGISLDVTHSPASTHIWKRSTKKQERSSWEFCDNQLLCQTLFLLDEFKKHKQTQQTGWATVFLAKNKHTIRYSTLTA